MSTIYYLHGGMPHHENENNDIFVKKILSEIPFNKIKIVLIYFAQKKENIEKCENQDIAQLNKNKGQKNLVFEVATEIEFENQVKNSNIIYIRGGETLKLIKILKKFPNLKTMFKNKVVVAESAGVYALSTFFYSKTLGGIFPGLKILPIKSICHFKGENQDKLSELSDTLESVLLSNYELKKIIQV